MPDNNPSTASSIILQQVTQKGRSDQPTWSKEQLKFRTLLESIEQLKASIEEQKKLKAVFESSVNQQLLPIRRKIGNIKYTQLIKLTGVYSEKKFLRKYKRFFQNEIEERIDELLTVFELTEEQRAHITKLYADHLGIDVEEFKSNEQEAKRAYLWNEFEIHIDEDENVDLNDPEIAARIRAKIEEQTSQQFEKSGKKNIKKEEDLQALLSKSIRTVYTALVKFLHPDKELDDTKKVEKTEAIKEVTKAYENKDMVTLLLLQTTYGLHEVTLDDKVMKTYNTILKNQMEELKKQKLAFKNAFQGMPMQNVSAIERAVKTEKNELKKQLKQEQSLLENYFDSKEGVEEYFKYAHYL